MIRPDDIDPGASIHQSGYGAFQGVSLCIAAASIGMGAGVGQCYDHPFCLAPPEQIAICMPESRQNRLRPDLSASSRLEALEPGTEDIDIRGYGAIFYNPICKVSRAAALVFLSLAAGHWKVPELHQTQSVIYI